MSDDIEYDRRLRDLLSKLAASERRVETLAAVCAAREAEIEDLRARLRSFGVVVGAATHCLTCRPGVLGNE